jgi:phosphoribosylanthranilate isomerase
VHVKVCGITNVDDALACVDAGASAIGLNFVPASPRCIDATTARRIADAIGDRALVVGVVADLDGAALERLRDDARLGCLQLHGDEPPSLVSRFLPHAYKAVRVATLVDLEACERFPGEHVLVDARVEGKLGGTGQQLERTLLGDVARLARRRRLTLAGGLRPDNVAQAIAAVAPYAVDVASGVEVDGDPRRKDLPAVRAFIAATRARSPGF